MGIKLNAVAKHERIARYCRKGCAVANTRIYRCARVFRIYKKPANPLCLGNGQRIKSQFDLPHETHFLLLM